MELFEQIFWGAALPSTVLLIFILISTFIGGDSGLGGDLDIEIDADAGAGFQFFTLKNLIGFFTIFGWVGIGCLRMGLGEGITTIIALLSGLAMMGAMAALFFFMSRLVEDGTFKVKGAIGRIGEIYLPVPPNRTGIGKVQFTVQGASREMQAMTTDTELLSTGTVVTIIDIVDGNILLVTKGG